MKKLHGRLAFASLFLGTCAMVTAQTPVDGSLKMEVIAAPNFVVDSNVESPSSYSPSAAHLGVKITNTGSSPMTDVVINIGDLTNPLTSTGTPGTFPARTVSVSGSAGYAGTFTLQMPGGKADAVRTVTTLAPGDSLVQYFFVTYPLKDPAGNSVAGAAPVPEDDLWLNYDIWATAQEGSVTRRVGQVNKATMRNEISAMANKIWPNTTSKVPDPYLDAIEQSLGWRPDSSVPRAGSTAQLEGIWYDLGQVGKGFDNNNDGLPDHNAWMQPVGDPGKYDPLAMRLVKCYGIVIVKLRDGTEKLIPFEDRLYFENLPADNTGAVGLVFYEFLPLASDRTATMSPYQEVASGFDNEKFNGDYGASNVALTSTPPDLTFDKTGPATTAAGNTASYTLSATNNDSAAFGLPDQSLPFVFQDDIPAGLVYVAGSATANNTIPAGNSVIVSWSTDTGLTWVTTEPTPASVTNIRWTLTEPLASAATAVVRFQATVPANYASVTVNNTGVVKLGSTGSLATDTVTTLLSGNNTLGDLIWKNDNYNSVMDGAETGVPNITVYLYYDSNNNESADSGEPLYATTQTNSSGNYLFSNLLDGNYVAVINPADSALPAGYSLANATPSSLARNVDAARASATGVDILTADWPLIPALNIVKSVSPTTYGAGELVTYTLDLENNSAPVTAKSVSVQTAWAATIAANVAAQFGANAVGSPNNVYARLDQNANADSLTASGFTFPDQTNPTITKVELLYQGYLSQPLVNDQMGVSVNGALFTTLTTAQLNAMTGPAALRAIDITSKNATWTWTLVNALTSDFKTAKVSNGDPGLFWMDAMGFRITTASTPPAAGTYGPSTINLLPLTDTYDASKLQYASASIQPTSISPGTLTWNNLGPLNAGTRKTLTVTFLALTPPDANANGEPDVTTTNNTITSAGAKFVSGLPGNSDTSIVEITINPRGSIGSTVWWDLNANGIKDSGEPGLRNVLVTLDNGAQTRTDSFGNYRFTNLGDATYTVTVNTPTLPWTTFTQTKDPDATVNNASTVIINNNDGISTNNSYLDRNFGYDSALNVISGMIFQDNNGNAVQNTGELPLAGITLTLSGSANATTTTDVNGYYSFGSLANGTYTVAVTPPGGTETLNPAFTNRIVSGGNLYPNNDFAYQPSGALSLGDTLYLDWDGNGSQAAGEEGIAGVDVLLYRDLNNNGVLDPATDPLRSNIPAVTDTAGKYTFIGLPAGNYIVVVNTLDAQFPTNVIQTQDYDGTRDSMAAVNLVSNLDTADFGYRPQGTASIGDTVYLDTDGDGGKDAMETGIADVGVTLYEDSTNNGLIDAGDAIVATTVTNSTGAYLFSGLAAGNYLVSVNQLAAAIPSDAYDNKYGLTNPNPHDVTLTAGQSYLAADFGFTAGATIGDIVFFDTNGNATQDFSEYGIPNVSVQLFLDADQDGEPDSPTPIGSTVTADGSGVNPAGFYQFTNLSAGTYFVEVLTSSLPLSGGQPIALTSDPDRDGIPVNDNSFSGLPAGDHADSLVILSPGNNYAGADFGYQPPGAIGDYVWLDLNQNGVQEDTEPGIANVAIQVTNGVITYNLTTDFDGRWSIANVSDGSWTATIPAANFAPGGPLESMAATYDADGGSNSTTAFVLTNGTVNLPAGNLGIDFGYKLNGNYSLAGTVATHDARIAGTADDIDDFYDDGTDQDAGPEDEIELSGQAIYLYTNAGRYLGSQTTDGQGNYAFTGLPAGIYRVVLNTTGEALQDSTLTTTAANHPAVDFVTVHPSSVIQDLTLTENLANIDFAFISNNSYDFGDLPLLYGMTTINHDGARHIIPAGGTTVYLGSAPDADTNGIPNALANGDDTIGTDDENGISPVAAVTWADGINGGSIQANATGSGWLTGWIDWNHDGDFLDPGEFIANQAVATGTPVVSFDIPAGTITANSQSWLSRFRLFATQPAYPLFSYTGSATNGEVEDNLLEKPVGASIGDLVWKDTNNNGLFDATENGIGGVTVVLRDNTDTIIATQNTGNGNSDVDADGVLDPLGYYRFRGLAAGTYTVTVSTPPPGFTPSYDEDGTGTANVSAKTLTTGEQHLYTDFGYRPMLSNISGQVRYDIDADGDFNDPDNGAMAVRIQLWNDPNGDGNPDDLIQVAETYTDANGNYLFASVPSGSYSVIEVNPPNSTSTADVVGPNDDQIPVTLVGTDITDRDFLDTMPPVYSIAGKVYDDDNATNNNVIGIEDTPLAAITIQLFLDRDADGTVSAGDSNLGTTTTDSAGSYTFTGLPAGNYVIQEIQPGGISDWDAQGSPTDNQIGVTLVDTNRVNQDFLDDGYLGTIGNLVWEDTNHNGLADPGEPGIGGVAIELYLATQTPGTDTPVAGTTTNGGGNYSFGNVVPGSYKIYLPTAPAEAPGLIEIFSAADNQIDNDNNGIQPVFGGPTSSPVFELSSGENETTIDFGFACQGTWEEWAFLNPLGGQNAPGNNPDSDSYDNLIEFAFNQAGDSGVGDPYSIRPSTTTPGTIEAVFVRPEGATENVTYTLEYTNNLGTPTSWMSIPISPAMIDVVSLGDCLESVTIRDLESLPALTPGTGFVRIRTDLDTEPTPGTEHTSYTQVEGWTETALGLCCRTYSNPYLHSTLYTGTVENISGQTITFAEIPGATDLATPIAGGAFYLEITSGENEGYRFDIASAAANSVTLQTDNDLFAEASPFNTKTDSLPGGLTGNRAVIRRHWTLGEQFPESGFFAAGTHTEADQVQFFTAGAWSTYWLYENAGTPQWVKIGDGDMLDRAATVIPPGQGCFVLRRNSSTHILAIGEVRQNQFVSPVQAGNNLIATGYPVDQSLNGTNGRDMNLNRGFFGSRDFKTADSVFIWKGDTVAGSNGYDTYYLLNRDPLPQIKWVKVGDATLLSHDAAQLLPRDASVFLRIKNNLNTYSIPTPWNP